MSIYPPDSGVYFFAYGSCMNQQSLSQTLGRESRTYFVSMAILANHRICFNYASLNEPFCCANIIPMPNHSVQGALYRIPTDLMSSVDRREGVLLQRYQRQWVSVVLADGREYITITYVASITLAHEAAPSERYQKLLLAGAEDAGVSAAYKNDLLRHMAQLPTRDIMDISGHAELPALKQQ